MCIQKNYTSFAIAAYVTIISFNLFCNVNSAEIITNIESQPKSHLKGNFELLRSFRTVVHSEIDEHEILYGNRYLEAIKFHCFFYNPSQHIGIPIPANQNTSPIADFTFSFSLARLFPPQVQAIFAFHNAENFSFIIHGWQDSYLEPKYTIFANNWMPMIAYDWRLFGHTNVIVVDWSDLASWDYFKASRGNSLYTAQIIKHFIDNLIFSFGFQYNNTLCVSLLTRISIAGHSLGAHIAGRVGSLYNGMIGTIYGLDPAGPLFEPPVSGIRHVLNYSDGQFVQVLHTAMVGNGNVFRMGAQDFYANGGGLQPGSKDKSWSHQKALNLFRASIILPGLAVGYECVYGSLQCCQSGLIREYIFGIYHQYRNIAEEPIFLPTATDPPYFLPLKLNSCQIPLYGKYYYYNNQYVIYNVGVLPSRFWMSRR